jgi:hypothetical protein
VTTRTTDPLMAVAAYGAAVDALRLASAELQRWLPCRQSFEGGRYTGAERLALLLRQADALAGEAKTRVDKMALGGQT